MHGATSVMMGLLGVTRISKLYHIFFRRLLHFYEAFKIYLSHNYFILVMHPVPRSFEWAICVVPVLGATCVMTGLFGSQGFPTFTTCFTEGCLLNKAFKINCIFGT